jgi:hypothetical protein
MCTCKLVMCNCRQLTDGVHGVGGVWSHPPKTNASGAAGSGAAGSGAAGSGAAGSGAAPQAGAGAEQSHPQPRPTRNPSEDEDAIHVVLPKQYSGDGEDDLNNTNARRQILVPNDEINIPSGFRRFLQWISGTGTRQQKEFNPEEALNSLTVKEFLKNSKLQFREVAARSLIEEGSEGKEEKVSTCCLFENKCFFLNTSSALS